MGQDNINKDETKNKIEKLSQLTYAIGYYLTNFSVTLEEAIETRRHSQPAHSLADGSELF